MKNVLLINSVIRYIESNITVSPNYNELEEKVGFTYRHIREVFKKYCKRSLKNYINLRKITYSAFEIETTDKSLTEISMDYGFQTYDTFTRCFKREIGVTPQHYKTNHCHLVDIASIGMGMYAPVLNNQRTSSNIDEENHILFGVPYIGYDSGKCTPFLSCLETILGYIGQREFYSYSWLMATTGASFRTSWNEVEINGSNSDIRNLSPKISNDIFRKGFQSAGWSCEIVEAVNSIKETFRFKIVESIKKGIPIIALGVVGPPEACIILGYSDNGNTLLGRSYFQDNPEFMSKSTIHPCGYFETNNWWNNITAIIIPEEKGKKIPGIIDVLKNIKEVMLNNGSFPLFNGQRAYDYWARFIKNDAFFNATNITAILLNSFFAEVDMETMVSEGRYWGADFFLKICNDFNMNENRCYEIADILNRITTIINEIMSLRKGQVQSEEIIFELCKTSVRQDMYQLILEAKKLEGSIPPLIEKLLISSEV